MYFCPTNEDFMRLLHILGLLTLSAQIYAVPARFHVFRAQMSDGTFQNIRFCGDEYRSYGRKGRKRMFPCNLIAAAR